MSASKLVFMVEEAPDGGYLTRAPGEAILTGADDLHDLGSMARDAAPWQFEEGDRSRVVPLHLVHDVLLAV